MAHTYTCRSCSYTSDKRPHCPACGSPAPPAPAPAPEKKPAAKKKKPSATATKGNEQS